MTTQSPASTLPRRTQKACCYTSAMASDATYCGDCGKALVRCMAAEECGGLLDDQGQCTICVAPQLQIDPGTQIAAKVGGALALTMSIANASVVGRPLFVTALWSKEAKGDWREEPLGWERLNAGESRPITVTANQFDHTGAHNLEVLIAVSSRWRWRKECYAFSAATQLTVEAEASKSGPVIQVDGGIAGHGNIIHMPGQSDQKSSPQTTTEAIILRMIRAEMEERRFGIRGLGNALWVPKDTRLIWKGFPARETPTDGAILTTDGTLAVGRARSRRAGGLGDVRLLVENSSGEIDEDTSLMLSRRHFELYVECNRLILHVTGSAGVRINGNAYGPAKTITLRHGDCIQPLVKAHDALALNVSFRAEHHKISEVTFTRTPTSKREA